MSIIEEADEIIAKDKITLKDYKRFCELRRMAKTKEDDYEFDWLTEAMYQKLPEVATEVGDYSFLDEEDKI